MWTDESVWNDLTYWSDSEEMGAATEVKTTLTATVKLPSTPLESAVKVISAGAIVADGQVSFSVPAGYSVMAAYINETADAACTIKAGTSAGAADWFAATPCTARGVTTIGLNKLLSASAASDVYLTFTAGTGMSVDLFFLTVKII